MSAEKYTLTKKDHPAVRTNSETVKVNYLADGYEVRENKNAPAATDKSASK